MKSFFLNFWETLRGSYWFVPALMTAGAFALSFTLLSLDQRLHVHSLTGFAWIYAGSAAGARSVLSTVASSIITVAGTTFSITIAALSLASSQFGPRLLRGFLRDTGNQVVLGTFIGTFVYCLLVLRTIRGMDNEVFVPNLAVTGGVILALASVGVLIYFINHVSASIQASNVIASVSGELNEAIDRLYPTRIGKEYEDIEQTLDGPEALSDGGREIIAESSGYVQILDESRLMELAREADGVLEVARRPGTFVTEGAVLARLRADRPPPEDFRRNVNKAFVLGPHRTMTQDAGFGVDQLVEVAIRALSPGINDPFTAVTCLDRLGAGLARLATRRMPSARRYDDDGALRVVAEPLLFPEMVDASFDQIRQYGSDSYLVTLRLLETLEAVGAQAEGDDHRDALRRQAELIHAGAEAIAAPEDRRVVAARYARVLKSLNA
ncbi:MAG: DUF2254 domain-containing protein [Armatimonadota bacterium]|nr:DUF2254 domain-containing protein [Armatimonadota bacterium]